MNAIPVDDRTLEQRSELELLNAEEPSIAEQLTAAQNQFPDGVPEDITGRLAELSETNALGYLPETPDIRNHFSRTGEGDNEVSYAYRWNEEAGSWSLAPNEEYQTIGGDTAFLRNLNLYRTLI